MLSSFLQNILEYFYSVYKKLFIWTGLHSPGLQSLVASDFCSWSIRRSKAMNTSRTHSVDLMIANWFLVWCFMLSKSLKFISSIIVNVWYTFTLGLTIRGRILGGSIKPRWALPRCLPVVAHRSSSAVRDHHLGRVLSLTVFICCR